MHLRSTRIQKTYSTCITKGRFSHPIRTAYFRRTSVNGQQSHMSRTAVDQPFGGTYARFAILMMPLNDCLAQR